MPRNTNRESARKSDVTKPGRTERVSEIEKVGGPTGVRFPVHNHPDHSKVRGPQGKMDR